MACTVEILCLGNELLIGKILNTNAQWLSRYISRLGGIVKRITVVGDDVQEISSAINEAIFRNRDFIITTGGLGPTFDDKTLEAISKALKRKIMLNKLALDMVKRRYNAYEINLNKKFDLTPERIKMAELPKGAEPMPNRVGTAPGVIIRHKGTNIITLPGVPQEMRAVFEDNVAQMIRVAAGNLFVYEKSLRITTIGESEIAPLVDSTMRNNPYVYIKSHPQYSEAGPKFSWIELHIFTVSDSKDKAKKIVEKASEQISQLITKKRGMVKPMIG